MTTYEKLIAALQIFIKYNKSDPLMVEHDEMWAGPDPSEVSEEDVKALEALGWTPWDTGNFHIYV